MLHLVINVSVCFMNEPCLMIFASAMVSIGLKSDGWLDLNEEMCGLGDAAM